MSDLINRADAIEAIRTTKIVFDSPIDGFVKHDITDLVATVLTEAFEALPSADADGEDLIIKGAKGIQDGLYNITDGKLFKYKAKGGTVRTYPIVPSADADRPLGEWQSSMIPNERYVCSVCGGACWYYDCKGDVAKSNFCPNCGARMKDGAE